MKKRVLAMAMALCLALSLLPVTAGAADGNNTFFDENGIRYLINEDGTTVSVISDKDEEAFGQVFVGMGVPTYSGEITIPETVKDGDKSYTVTEIASSAFYYTNISTITIPASLKEIGNSAFNYCKLKEIIIPTTDLQEGEGLSTIGSYAFAYCQSLSEISLPNTVETIGTYAFWNCTALENVSIPADAPLSAIETNTFLGCRTLETVSIPDAVTTIGESAFASCSGMTSLEIPDGVTSIGSYAFAGCGAESLTIPASVTANLGVAIKNYEGEITIESGGPYEIVNNGLYHTDGDEITLELLFGGETTFRVQDGTTRIARSAFENDISTTTIIVPASVTEIDAYAFDKATQLSTLIMLGDTPPTVNGVLWNSSSKPKDLTVIIPAGSEDEYAKLPSIGDIITGSEETPDTEITYELPLAAISSVNVGNAMTVTARLPTGADLSVTSDNTGVATATVSGSTITVTGISAGTAAITASIVLNGITLTEKTCAVTVTAPGTSTPSGSDNSEPSYSPVMDVSDGGTVRVNPRTPSEGDRVTLTVTPDSGYGVGGVTVTDRSGRGIDVTANRDGTYTFTQPRGRVTISVEFVREGGAAFFADVPETYWAYDEIAWASGNGYVNGTTATTFSPGASVSRQQVWMILARLSGADPADMTAARVWAVENGISDGTNPGTAVTRQQLAALLFRFAQSNGYDNGQRSGLSAFPDAGDAAAYAVEPLRWATAGGIISGTSQGTLNPAGTATRAQFTVMLYRFWTNV